MTPDRDVLRDQITRVLRDTLRPDVTLYEIADAVLALFPAEPPPACPACGDVPGYCPECGGGQAADATPPLPPSEAA